MALNFDKENKVIIVEAPALEVTIQELINAVRSWEAAQENMDMPQVAMAVGKDDLGGGLLVGITLRLLDQWQIMFEDRLGPDYVQCTIKDGNLVGGISGNPIKESAYTQVKLILSAAGTISGLGEVAQENSLQDLRNKIGVPTSTVSSDVNDIQAKTANLPDDPADQSEVEGVLDEVANMIVKKLGELETAEKKSAPWFKI